MGIGGLGDWGIGAPCHAKLGEAEASATTIKEEATKAQ